MVTFSEHGPHRFREKNNRSWKLGDEVVEESNEYKNVGVVKNYVGSFQSDVDEAIEKTRKKARMILNGCTNSKNTSPLICIKLWRQACLPTLSFGSELLILRQTQILELERCQSWFLRKVFHLPKFCDNSILIKISGLWSIESAVNYRKLLFIARVINRSSEDNVYRLLLLRKTSFLKQPDDSIDLVTVFKKYDLYDLFLDWATEDQCLTYPEWKCTLTKRIITYENCLWETYVESHLHLSLLHQTFSEISPTGYWTITSLYPDLVPKLNTQLRLMVNFGLQSG